MDITSNKKNNQKGIQKGILLGLPFLLFLILLTVLSFTLLGNFIKASPLFLSKLTENNTIEPPVLLDNSGEAFYVPEEFPTIAFGEQYATLTVADAQIYNQPIFFGDTDEFLKKGIGHFAGSRFPGQNGNCVLSAHVTTIFRWLEDLSPGAVVELTTKYGKYVYEVEELVVFDAVDSSLLLPTDGTERLTCYTCYPFNNNGTPRTERIAILCKKISGKNWKTGEE